MRRSILILVMAFSLQGWAKAQDGSEDVWSLERCINYAYENNLAIKRSRLSTDLVQKDYNQAKYNLLPGVGGAVEHQLSSGRSLNLEKYEWENKSKQQGSLGVQADLTLFDGFQNYNNIQANKFLLMSTLEDQESLKNNITLNLAGYYLQILLDQELIEVAKQQYKVTLLQVEKNQKLVDVGNVARGDLLEIQAQAASEKLNLVEAQTRYRNSVLDLVQLLDLDSIGNFTVIKPEIEMLSATLPPDVNEIYNMALKIMPEIKSGQYLVKAQEKRVAYNQGGRSPQVYLRGLYYSRYLFDAPNPLDPNPENPSLNYSVNSQVKDNRYAEMTLGVSFPIFNRFYTQTNISKSKVQLQDYNLALDQDKQVLYKSIQQAHANATSALERYNSASEAVRFNEEAFNYTTQKFDVGLVNSVDFNVAKNNLSKAQSDLAQAKYEYIFRMKILDFYQGKEIHL